MNVSETLRAHYHHLGAFTDQLLEELGETLSDESQEFVVLVPTEHGIEALRQAALGFAHESHSAHDHVATGASTVSETAELQTLSGQPLAFQREGHHLLCNGVIVHASKSDGPRQATNGTIYTIDRPLQFYDQPSSSL